MPISVEKHTSVVVDCPISCKPGQKALLQIDRFVHVLPPDHAARLSWMSGDPYHMPQTTEGCLHWPSQQSKEENKLQLRKRKSFYKICKLTYRFAITDAPLQVQNLGIGES